MGTSHRSVEASASTEPADSDAPVQTRYQAPIRHLKPARPEVPASTAMQCTVPATQLTESIAVIGPREVNGAATTTNSVDATGSLAHFTSLPVSGGLPAFLRTYTAEDISTRKRQLRHNLLVRCVILTLLGLVEGLIIAQYTQPLAVCFWLVAALYITVQAWPLMRPPVDAADASVYSIWAICSLIGYIAVGLVLSPITFLLLMLDWEGVSLGLDPMVVLGCLALVWVSEVGLSLLTIYRFNNLRVAITHQAMPIFASVNLLKDHLKSSPEA